RTSRRASGILGVRDATGRQEGAMERRLTRTVGSPGSGLVWSKLTPPAPRAGTLPRSGLQSLLQAGLEAKLCLLDAPAGSGKTTLLAQWSATAGAGRGPGSRWTRGDTTR